MKKNKTVLFLLACSLLLAGCSAKENTGNNTEQIQNSSAAGESEQSAADENKTDSVSDEKSESNESADQSGSDNGTQNSQSNNSEQTDQSESEETKDDDIEIEGAVEASGNKIDLSVMSNPVKITSGGTYEISGMGHMLIVDAKKQDVKLILDGVSLTNDSLPPLYIKKAASVTIELKNENTIEMGSQYQYESLNAALYSKADLIIEGDGTLNVTSGYEHGIKAKDTAQFKSGTYHIEAENDGIHVNETAVFDGGTYQIKAAGEGIESKDSMTVNGGSFQINAYDDAINAINSLVINDGDILVVSQNNDGIDSNGDLIINGGQVTSIGTNMPEQAFDTDQTPFEINGGKVLGIGSSLITPTSNKSPVILVGASGTISSVEIKDQSGTSVASWELPNYSAKSNQVSLTISDPSLKIGDTYTVYVNGSEVGSATLEDSVTQIGNVDMMGNQMGGRPMGRPGFKGGNMEAPNGNQPGFEQNGDQPAW